MERNKRWMLPFVTVLSVLLLLSVGYFHTTVQAAPYLNYTWMTVPKDGTMKLQVKGTGKKVKWKSSNKKIATVSKKGVVTGKKNGKCTITAKVGGKKLKCKVTVKGQAKKPKKKAFTKTTLNVLSLKMNVNAISYDAEGNALLTNTREKYKLRILNTSKSVKWSSSNLGVATVKKGMVTAVAAGSCTISASVGKKSYSCKVVVTDLMDAEAAAKQKYIYEMLGYMNVDRVKIKAAPLKIKEEVNQVADLRVEEICLPDHYNHTRPNGESFKTAYAQLGIPYGAVMGENLGFYADNTKCIAEFTRNAYDALYNQKEHKEMMMSRKYDYVGISYKKGPNYKNDAGTWSVNTYWAQEFYTK